MSVPKLGSKLRRVLLARSTAAALTAGVLAGLGPAYAAIIWSCNGQSNQQWSPRN